MLIRLENVSKHYLVGESIVPVLKNINLDVKQGEFLAIMGMSGSGKSTLMNIIGLLDQCSAGDYYFYGKKISDFSLNELANLRNHKIGFIFQSFFLLLRSNVIQNVMLPLYYRGIAIEEARVSALTMLEKVGMKDFAERMPNQLSGGQQQRVAIARALVGNPDLILADEPTGALDSVTGQEVMDLLSDLHQSEKKTIIVITHDRQISLRCHRVISIQDGQL